MEQSYRINVAKAHPTQKKFMSSEPLYMHHHRISFDWLTPREDALARLADTRERYPAPEFKCSLSRWVLQGEQIDAG